jgi:hypothetical protein
MPDHRRVKCQNCGGHKRDVGDISWSGLCRECGKSLMVENISGMHTKSGFVYQRYKLGAARGLFGEQVTQAMFKAGIFTVPIDEAAEGR